MAEAVVGLLIGKLGAALAKEAATYGVSLLCKEASAIKDLFGQIRKAELELESIKACLHDAEKFRDTDETTGIFIKKIRDLAFRIEDVVDEFTYKLEDDKHGGFASKMTKRIKHVKIWRRLAIELGDINTELREAAERKDRYAMSGMERYTTDSGHHARCTNQTPCPAREDDLVGIEDNANKLKQWLLEDLKERNKKITSVWGMGGAGKTTLVDHVYNIVKENFDAAAWVTVSKDNYQFEDLLKNIAREFGILDDARTMELRNLVGVIRRYIEGKKYILVLDDVWEKEVCMKIMEVFPTKCISRVVLTSRKYDVAQLASSNCAIKVEPLAPKYSWKLFCNLAFQNNDDKRCSSELSHLATKFLEKCEGLPLAISCIGRLLSYKAYSEWEKVYEELERQPTTSVIPGVDSILKVSLDDLPYELKNCFLHCAIFPEDYELRRKRLIRHWTTAGFVKEKENKILEEVADGYLNELVNRSLLQVVKKNEIGRVKCCRMHDVIRHLALEKAEKECFGKVYKGSGTFSVDGTRRLSIQSTNITPLSQSGARHLRAIHAFTCYVDIDLLRPILASSNLLSTLDLQGTQIKMLPDEVFSLFNLRFLGLRNTGLEILPEAVGRLENLEVLDALGTGLLSLPKDVAKLKKLRFLYACTLQVTEGALQYYVGIKVPRGIRNLTGLHVLYEVKANSEIVCDVAALTELRKFAVCDVTSGHFLNLCKAIMNMRHLVHLSITASDENEVLPLEALHLPGTLSKLHLECQLEKKGMPQILSSWSHLNNLTRLFLVSSKLDEDSFSSLMVLRGLCFLFLAKAYDGKKMCFPTMSFPRLRELMIVRALQLNQVEIAEGALESLVKLEFRDCPELKHLPHGIEYLTALEELYLKDTAEELIEKLRQESEANECSEELMKISHIKKVTVILTVKNIWERIR